MLLGGIVDDLPAVFNIRDSVCRSHGHYSGRAHSEIGINVSKINLWSQ
jgi:hypothetical protein